MLATLLAAVALRQMPYADINAAAAAALSEAYKCGENRRECGGAIYAWLEPSTKKTWYFYTSPETSNKPFGVEITALYDKTPGTERMKLVADYHNHICSIHNQDFAAFFSAGDAIVNQAMHTVGYMLDGCTGTIHAYDPSQDDADDEEVDMVSGKVFYLTIGHISGHIQIRTK